MGSSVWPGQSRGQNLYVFVMGYVIPTHKMAIYILNEFGIEFLLQAKSFFRLLKSYFHRFII